MMLRHLLAGATLATGIVFSAAAQLPTLPAGAPIRISAVTQPLPTQPQYTRVDIPVLRDGTAARSNGRVQVQLSTHAERNLAGNEIVRLVRSGQVEIGAGTLTTLSGGQLQRTYLARAVGSMSEERRLLLADEPTSALDFDGQDDVANLLADLSATRLVVSHDAAVVAKADRVLEMAGGSIRERAA
jgi:predicted ABC-type transport system involved in lysophospholipase L1 biosynthesis ATPase subunit